jgi:hypothetical protein
MITLVMFLVLQVAQPTEVHTPFVQAMKDAETLRDLASGLVLNSSRFVKDPGELQLSVRITRVYDRTFDDLMDSATLERAGNQTWFANQVLASAKDAKKWKGIESFVSSRSGRVYIGVYHEWNVFVCFLVNGYIVALHTPGATLPSDYAGPKPPPKPKGVTINGWYYPPPPYYGDHDGYSRVPANYPGRRAQ